MALGSSLGFFFCHGYHRKEAWKIRSLPSDLRRGRDCLDSGGHASAGALVGPETSFAGENEKEVKNMICDRILGKVSDTQFAGLEIDYVDVEWHEAFSRLHRKISQMGEDVGIRMGNEVLKRGLNQDDVLYADARKVIAVNIPECEAIRAAVDKDHPGQIARLCYEVGNTHTSMFRGEDAFTFYTPYHEALLQKLDQLHGVTVEKVWKKFDFTQALSSAINNHHH